MMLILLSLQHQWAHLRTFLVKLNYIPSYANFIAVEFKDAMSTYNSLLKEGVKVRPVEMKNYLRISIGTPNENDHLLEALGKVL